MKRILLLLFMVMLILAGCKMEAIQPAKEETEEHEEKQKSPKYPKNGIYIVYEIIDKDATDEQISDTVNKITTRAEVFSDKARVSNEGPEQITVYIPSVTDAEEVLENLGRAGYICFIYGMGSSGNKNIDTDYYRQGNEFNYQLLRSLEEIRSDGDVVIDGNDITDAKPYMTRDDLNGTISYAVQLELNDEGREKFALATSYCYSYADSIDEDRFRNIIAIVYDNEVISAPRVADVIDGGQAMISSLKSAEEASLLASTIRSGVLSLELKPVNCYVEGEEFNIDEWQEKKSAQDGDDGINGDDN